MSVSRKLVKTPLGIVEYLWLDGGLVPYEVLRELVTENKKEEPRLAAPLPILDKSELVLSLSR